MKKLLFLFLLFFSFSTSSKCLNTINFSKENTIYEISGNYDLAGKTVTIPDGCTLKFKGGIIKNGCLKGNGTAIEANYLQMFDTNVHFSGTWKIEYWRPEWFGAKGEKGHIDTKTIQCALDAANDTDTKVVRLLSKTYYTDATLNVYPYTSLVGSEQTASWLYATQIMPSEKVDAIRLTAAGNDVRSTGVTLKNLIIRNGSGDSYTNVGVLISKDTERFGVDRLRMDNVQILYFEYGIRADLYGDAPFAYCNFRNVETGHNNIGLYVEGHYEGGKNGHKIWMNVNRFEFCRFSENRIGGIYIHNVWTLLNNVFDQCTIEGNGSDYLLSLYNKDGIYGVKIANWYTPSSGGNVFHNCYFEGNYPRRKGGLAAKGEYKYEEYIYPDGFTENKKTGNVVLQQHDFCFINCISSRNKNFVLLNDNSHVDITGSKVFDRGSVSKIDSKRYFIEFNDAYVPSSVNTERNNFKISKENSLQYFHFIATPKGGESKYTIRKDDLDDGGIVQLDNMPVRQLLKR